MTHSQHGLSKKTIAYVYKRACNRCEHCFSKKRLEVHHIVTRGRGRGWRYLNNAVNLALLCNVCHRIVHDKAEEDYQKWLMSVPPNDCTRCGAEWRVDSEERKIACSSCSFDWEF
jgi:hypothetical protein